MSEPPEAPPPATTPPWAAAVVIPTLWTPEQALAAFELLDDLRETIWTLYGQIQTLLKEEQQHADVGAGGNDVSCDDHSF